jgi:glycosyltransferase involved in cell wall biosynthesis
MRVAYITKAPFISGAERSLQTLLRYVAEAGVEPVVVGPPGCRLFPWCESQGIPFEACPLEVPDKWHLLRWWSSQRHMRSVLRTQRIELVHSNQIWSYPAVGTAARALRLPRICHMRDEVTPEAVRWWLAAGVEGIVCVSRHIERQVAAGLPAAPPRPWIATLLNPVVLPDLAPEEDGATRRAARQRFGLTESAVVFGFLGQMVPIKGLPPLLEALAGLRDDPRWHLLIAGEDPRPGRPHEAECRRLVRERGLTDRVHFLGFLDDVTPVYQALDCAVVPSLVEPVARIPLEAAAHARPVIGFATGGLPEIVRHNETGWLAPTGDVEALRGLLAAFVDRPTREFGLAARAWVQQTCAPQAFAQRIAELYRQHATNGGVDLGPGSAAALGPSSRPQPTGEAR